MTICAACDNQNAPGAKFCGSSGACINCGAALAPDARFRFFYGTPVG